LVTSVFLKSEVTKDRTDQGPKCLNHFGARDQSVHHMIVQNTAKCSAYKAKVVEHLLLRLYFMYVS